MEEVPESPTPPVARDTARRFVVGIGVSTYDDPELNLAAVPDDVAKITRWFAERSSVPHERALPELADSPRNEDIVTRLRDWLEERAPEDYVVVYLAAHADEEAGTPYVLGRDSVRQRFAGRAIDGNTLGTIIGQSPPHNVLFIVDACVAGTIGKAIQRRAEDVSEAMKNRQPQLKWSQAVLCSTFGRDPASDGRFAEAFLTVVTQERWTGTSRPFIDIDLLMTGLNQELKNLNAPQVADRKVWGPGAAELIPNPNFGARQVSALIADEELASHFDPSARGVTRGESGSYFIGRHDELARIVQWLRAPAVSGTSHLLVITGSPGSGKSALISRVVLLSDPALRARVPRLHDLAPETVPPDSSITAALWCHNKTLEQVVVDLGSRLGLNARAASALLYAIGARQPAGSPLTIAIDALDEAVDGHAARIASELIVPLASLDGVKVLVATRPHPVHSLDEPQDATSLLESLGIPAGDDTMTVVVDNAANRGADMRAYVEARLMGTGDSGRLTPYSDKPDVAARLAERIAEAAGSSFLVAAVTARALSARPEAVDPEAMINLPTEAGDALARYIERLPDPKVVIDILRPLAWAAGSGLPWGPLWAPIANALARAPFPDADVHYDDDMVATVLERASDLVIETMESDEPVYRLFHAALAEHLRRDLTPLQAHEAIAGVLDTIIDSAPFRTAPAYVLAHMTTHLAQCPSRYQQLYELVTDPEWERAKRDRFRRSEGFFRDVELAIQGALARDPQDLASLAGACLVCSRQMAVAPAPVIDVLAKERQLQRAEAMANNITFAVERCWAYALLAPTFHAERDVGGALRCLGEAERSIGAINVTHTAMAWSWIAEAAVACGFGDRAMLASRRAAESLDALTRETEWELPNVFFWAGMTARHARDEATRAALREMFGKRVEYVRRNQELQAAAVLGATDTLRELWRQWMSGERDGFVRHGNLALALADAGMMDELRAMLAVFETEGVNPRREANSNKHFVWALCRAGRFDWALRFLETVDEPEHWIGALSRLVSEAVAQGNAAALESAKGLVNRMAGTNDDRVKTRMVPILYRLGDKDAALMLAEDLVRQGAEPSATNSVAFPLPDEVQPVRQPVPQPVRGGGLASRRGKTGPRPLHTDIRALADARVADEAAAFAEAGKIAEAKAKLSAIVVPRFRWRAAHAIASAASAAEAVPLWRDALLEARLVNEPSARITAAALATALAETSDGQLQVDRLTRNARAITKAWTESAFAEQYETLRELLASGVGRTRRMDELIAAATRTLNFGGQTDWVTAAFQLPYQLLDASGGVSARDQALFRSDLLWGIRFSLSTLWSVDEVRALIESGRPGKRAFALALMKSRADLAPLDLVIALIETSLSAFEQFHALTMALKVAPSLDRPHRSQLREAIERARRTHLVPDTDRYALSERILAAMADRG